MTLEKPKLIVAIYLRGDRLRPDYISQLLGLQPSRCQTKGELRAGSETVTAKIGIWNLVAQTDSPSIEDHINELLDKIGMPLTPLDQIDSVEEAYLDIFSALDEEHGQRQAVECILARKYTKALDQLGLSIHFTVA